MLALTVQLRLLAPFLPYVTEEVWSWWQEGSVHRAAWPTADDLPTAQADAGILPAAAAVLAGIRGAKSTAKVSQRTEVVSAVARGPEGTLLLAEQALVDVAAAGRVVGDLSLESADLAEVTVEATLTESD